MIPIGNLREGDRIINTGSGGVYTIIHTHPLVAVQSLTVTNPHEWELLDVDRRTRTKITPDEKLFEISNPGLLAELRAMFPDVEPETQPDPS